MQRVSELMTRDVRFVVPQENLQRAAQMMDELNVGALPVCDGGRLVGMVTDRDITIRATAAGKSPRDAHVDEVMSTDVRWCFEDQSLDDVMAQMAGSQVRRIPVLSHDGQHSLVGIVSLGDMAIRTADDAQKKDVEQMVEAVSSPSAPRRASAGGSDIGADLPQAGETGGGMGHGAVAGASGTGTPDSGRSGSTGDPRRNFGVGGQDLLKDGLPPA
jgi:CBS domain-containing protein